MLGLPSISDIRQMNDEDLQKLLEALKDRETQGLDWLQQFAAGNKFNISGTIGSTQISLTIETEEKSK